MTKLSKQKVLAVLLASVMTVSIAGMSTAYATDETATEATEIATEVTEVTEPTEVATEATETTETTEANDDNPAFENAKVLNINGNSVKEEFGEDEETEYVDYKIVLPTSGALTIDFMGNVNSASYLYSADGKINYGLLTPGNSPTPNSDTYYLYAGTYYLRVKPHSSFLNYIAGDYTLKATFSTLNNSEPNVTTTINHNSNNAMEIVLDTKYSTVLEENATETGDWYKLTLDKDMSLDFFFEHNEGAGFVFSILKCIDEETQMPDNTPLSTYTIGNGNFGWVWGNGTSANLTTDTLEKGTYYIVVGDNDALGTGFYMTKNTPCLYTFSVKEHIEIPTEPTEPTEPLTTPTTPTTPTSVTNPTPTGKTTTTTTTTTTTGGSTGSNTSTGKVATGDTKSVIGLIAGLLASTGAIITTRRKRSAK